MKIKIKKMREGAILPEYQSAGAAGFDIHACIDETVILQPGGVVSFPTGIGVEIPEGYELQVRSRSGLAFKDQVCMLHALGTIDSDYRGEIKILLKNHGDSAFAIEPGARIAQGVVTRVERVEWEETEELSETTRADGGLGSTGIL